MRLLKYLAAPALALSFVALSPMVGVTARAAPAAGVLAVDRSDAKPAVENVHYRRSHYRYYRHYRPHHVYRGYYGRPYRHSYYGGYTPGFYLNIGPRFGYGWGHGHRRHRHW